MIDQLVGLQEEAQTASQPGHTPCPYTSRASTGDQSISHPGSLLRSTGRHDLSKEGSDPAVPNTHGAKAYPAVKCRSEIPLEISWAVGSLSKQLR